MTNLPMQPDVLRAVILGTLEDWAVDEFMAGNRLNGLVESLAESWLKDRQRAILQAIRATGSNPGGAP